MLRPRFYDVRVSGMPESVGLCDSDIRSVAATVNEAQERLINDPLAPEEGFWGGWIQMAFNVTRANPYIVTPREVARIILLDVCKRPVRIRNSFYEYLEFGRGFMPSGCSNVSSSCGQILAAYERETVVTASPLAGTAQYIRVYPADPNDVGRTVIVQGADSNGKTVLRVDPLSGQSTAGEQLTLASPFTDTVNLFTTIDGIQKVKTFGEVQFFQVDPATMAESPLVVMQPGEETALYRKYYVNGLPQNCCNATTQQVLAMCKLDFIPVSSDGDYLTIPSVPAIIDECMSVRFGRMDSPTAQQMSATKHASALRILFGQLDHVLGKERPAIRRSLFGNDTLKLQPV